MKEVSCPPFSLHAAEPLFDIVRNSYLLLFSAFRDRNAGSANNRGKPTDDAGQERQSHRTRGTYDGRGGRGNRGDRQFDRHSRTVGGLDKSNFCMT
jgi:hypothetical protein